jgi:hypothetical protein
LAERGLDISYEHVQRRKCGFGIADRLAAGDGGSQRTHCWREMDSNLRYPAKFLAALSIPAQFTFRNITGSLAPGTDGSNPSPSSTESGANFTQVRHRRSGFPECLVIRQHGRLILD